MRQRALPLLPLSPSHRRDVVEASSSSAAEYLETRRPLAIQRCSGMSFSGWPRASKSARAAAESAEPKLLATNDCTDACSARRGATGRGATRGGPLVREGDRSEENLNGGLQGVLWPSRLIGARSHLEMLVRAPRRLGASCARVHACAGE